MNDAPDMSDGHEPTVPISSTPDPLYRPGDVVNGHVLTQDGVWVPLGGFPTTPQTAPVPVVYAAMDHGQGSDLAPRLAMSTGIGAAIVGIIPCVGIVGVLLGGIAILFGFIGLQRGKSEHKIASGIGLGCGAIGLLLGLFWTYAMFSGLAALDPA